MHRTRAVAACLLVALAAPAAGDSLGRCADAGLPPSTTLEACRDALRDPGLAPGTRARVLVNLGVAQAAIRRHGDAVRTFTLAIRTDPALVEAHSNRARSHAALGRTDAALADFDAAIALAPQRAELWSGRGALRLRAGDADGAVADLDRAVQLAPEDLTARFNRGLAALEAGAAETAVRDFALVIRDAPDDAPAHLYRAEARAALGRADAGADYDRAIALRPDWGRAWYLRGRWHDGRGARAAADRDFLRAYELGVDDRWLAERVQSLGG